MFRIPVTMELFRLTRGEVASSYADDFGYFLYDPAEYPNHEMYKPLRRHLQIIATSGRGTRPEWEHVSVTAYYPKEKAKGQWGHVKEYRTPSWGEMCAIKDVFWDEEDCVMQLHPPKSDYVNCHNHVLHLWRPRERDVFIPRPPKIMV